MLTSASQHQRMTCAVAEATLKFAATLRSIHRKRTLSEALAKLILQTASTDFNLKK